MSDAHNHRASDRVGVELIEADVDIWRSASSTTQGRRITKTMQSSPLPQLEDANKVLMDIEDRLSKLDAPHSAPFGPLVEALRKEIRAAQVECAQLLGPPSRRLVVSFFLTPSRPGRRMSAEELNELKERAEKAAEKGLAPVSLTMAVVAVLVATISLLGHRAHTEEILLQNKTTDEWAYYQAKNLRRNNLEALNDVLAALEGKNERAEQVSKRFEADIEKFRDEQKDIQSEARKLEDELRHETRRANRFDLAEVFLEISLVVTSITLLTGLRHFWVLGIVLAVTGLVVASTVLLLQ
jgi:hypothetical protein